jgi:hypothetical protein
VPGRLACVAAGHSCCCCSTCWGLQRCSRDASLRAACGGGVFGVGWSLEGERSSARYCTGGKLSRTGGQWRSRRRRSLGSHPRGECYDLIVCDVSSSLFLQHHHLPHDPKVLLQCQLSPLGHSCHTHARAPTPTQLPPLAAAPATAPPALPHTTPHTPHPHGDAPRARRAGGVPRRRRQQQRGRRAHNEQRRPADGAGPQRRGAQHHRPHLGERVLTALWPHRGAQERGGACTCVGRTSRLQPTLCGPVVAAAMCVLCAVHPQANPLEIAKRLRRLQR